MQGQSPETTGHPHQPPSPCTSRLMMMVSKPQVLVAVQV